MSDPKVKIMNCAVSFRSVEEHNAVEGYCQREFGHDLITQLTKVCEAWLKKAVECATEEEKVIQNMIEKNKTIDMLDNCSISGSEWKKRWEKNDPSKN